MVEISNRFACFHVDEEDNEEEETCSNEFSLLNFDSKIGSISTNESYWNVKFQPEQQGETRCSMRKTTKMSLKVQRKPKTKCQFPAHEDKTSMMTTNSPSIPQYRSMKTRSTNQCSFIILFFSLVSLSMNIFR